MNPSQIQALLTDAINGRRLLDHPFYQRWEEGKLTAHELTRYAEEYRHIEAELPLALTSIVTNIDDERASRLVQDNLDDELSNPRAHTELFESFADAVGASPKSAPSSATAELVNTYRELAEAGPASGLAGIGAYEIQAAGIAATKGESLREHYLLTEDQTCFWDLHARLEDDHAMWTCEVLAILPDDDDGLIADSARRSADAWWNFLNEREREAQLVTVR